MKTTGNTILITGGTSGIGWAFAEEFVKLKNKVIVCGRRENRLTELKAKYPEVVTKTCDVGKEEQRKELVQWTLKNYPDINILINNAGIQQVSDLTKPMDSERIRQEMEINFVAPVHLSSLFAAHLAAKAESAIINISSGLSFTPLARVAVYSASKAAIHSLTLSLRYQLRKTSVKVFEIAPPAVDTELGPETREDPTKSHGGIPVAQFLEEAMDAIKKDILEAPVGMAKNLMEKREGLFPMLNPQ